MDVIFNVSVPESPEGSGGESSGSRIRKRAGPWGGWDAALVLLDSPISPCVGATAGRLGVTRSAHCPGAAVPGSSGRCGSRPAGRRSACNRPFLASSATRPRSTCCSSRCGRAQENAQDTGRHRGQRTPRAPTHRHTYTSRGGWVLGVIIQGATRNTTVSVKMGVSGEILQVETGGKQTAPRAQRPSKVLAT